MSTGAMIFIVAIALVAIVCLAIDMTDKNERLKEIGKLKESNQMFKDQYCYWFEKYWQLHDMHYGKVDDAHYGKINNDTE